MSTIMGSSYTAAASRSPVLPAPPLVLARSSWNPAVAAFRPSATVKCRRPLTVTCALPEKERPPAFSIPPTALLCPVPPPDGKERWDIKEEDDRVTLWLQMPGLSANDIEVTTGEDVLEIKRKVTTGRQQAAGAADAHGVGEFHIRLLMTKEYDGSKVTADLNAGMLEVTVPKNPQRGAERVELGKPAPARGTRKGSDNETTRPPEQTPGTPRTGGRAG